MVTKEKEVWKLLGKSELRYGRLEAARGAFEAAADEEGLLNVAKAYVARLQLDTAREVLLAAGRNDGLKAVGKEVLIVVGNGCLEGGRLETACVLFEAADHRTGLVALVNKCVGWGSLDLARKASGAVGHGLTAYQLIDIGQNRVRAGDVEAARTAFEAAVSLLGASE